jgi:thiosulfate/3-mercaptopyruvate sulfurtransferase
LTHPSASPRFIVGTEWLADRLDAADIAVVDATTHLVPRPDTPYDVISGLADFHAGHLPGARFADIDAALSDRTHSLHFMLPAPEQFADAMADLGISDETLVVCYSSANHWWATRLWWMLRVFGHDAAVVLDGGLPAWRAEGRPIERGDARAHPRGRFTARFRPEQVADRDAVRAAIGAAGVCTVNALRPEQHAGGGNTNYGRPGHITGSINLPAVEVVGPDHRFLPEAELRARLAPALAASSVITYCGGGIAASSIAMLLTMFGHPDVRLYDASLSEWAPDPTLPMSTAATPA